MRANKWLGLGLIILGTAIATYAVLGPFVLEVIRFRTSALALNQIIGGDAAALFVVAPLTIAIGVLALRGHPAAPVLALAPAIFALYTYSQLILGNEYLRVPGNVERFFPLLLGIFVLAGAVTVYSWRSVDAGRLPATPRRLERVAGIVLLVAAAYVVAGLHLASFADAMRDGPTGEQYLAAPTAFWVVKLWDLGIVVPAALVVGVGLLRGRTWARKPMYAIVGGLGLLGASVAAMAINMYVNNDPDATLGQVVAMTALAVVTIGFAVNLYRPLFRRTSLTPTDPPQPPRAEVSSPRTRQRA